MSSPLLETAYTGTIYDMLVQIVLHNTQLEPHPSIKAQALPSSMRCMYSVRRTRVLFNT